MKLRMRTAPTSELVHINRQIPPEAHTSMYVWHKYWSRKTWNVVGEHIKAYTAPGEIVFDPFSGSGVVAIEAVRNGRRAIVCDLNPAASQITDLTLHRIEPEKLHAALERIRTSVHKRISDLYTVHCHKCGKAVVADCFVRRGEKVEEVRYKGGTHCGHRCEHGCKPRGSDLSALADLENARIAEWYPKNELAYSDTTPFMKREKYKSLDQLFTKRNLRAAAILYSAIEQESSPSVRKFLIGGFTAMIHLCTRMMPVGNPAPSNHYTYFSSPGWTQHSYWSAPKYMEQNVWDKFEGSINGSQGLINAKKDSNTLPEVKITDDWRKVLAGKADIAIITDDCLEVMKNIPDDSEDYIFTDTPHDSSVQYGELSYLWNAWLKKDYKYTDRIGAREIIRNEKQQKPLETYNALLSSSFQAFFKVLRPEHYLTLTFHNPTFRIRNAPVRAAVFAGFDYEHIHHQPLGQV